MMKRAIGFGLGGLLGGAALLVGLYATGVQPAAPAEAGVALPAPAADARESGRQAVAIFAGGCFWGVEGVFEHVRGVRSVTSGYAGGRAADANYEAVSSSRTGHAEAVRVVYDPSRVSYGTLLRIFFSVAHDPTQRNRQGPDTGPQYRSAIFPQNAEQRRVAEAYIRQIGGRFRQPIATRIESGGYWQAEAHHQDFMRRNPRHGYIVMHDAPKLRDLQATFPSLYSSQPVA